VSLFPPDAIDAALCEAAHAVPALGEVTRLDDTAWMIAFASGQQLLAEWTDDPPRLVLTAPLGQPEPAHELAACRMALLHNARWAINGPLRLGRDDEGEWLLLGDLPEPALSTPELPDRLLRFAAEQALWTLALQRLGKAGPAPSLTDPATAPFPAPGAASALRA